MPELEPQTPPDPIAALHKMSTTAGVTPSEYVAINNLAIIAAVLGLATAMAIPWTMFSIIGIGALVCGIIAATQIRRSNGTQGGAVLAWGGMALAAIFAGAGFTISRVREYRLDVDRRAINSVIQQLGQHVSQGDYAAAYKLLDDALARSFSPADFQTRWEAVQKRGRVLSASSNNIYEFFEAAGAPGARTNMRLHLEGGAIDQWRFTVDLRKTDNGWRIRSISELLELRGPPKPGPKKPPPTI
jgi:hypothetical protein